MTFFGTRVQLETLREVVLDGDEDEEVEALPTLDPTRVLSSVEIDRDERMAEDDLSTSTRKPLTSTSNLLVMLGRD